MSDPTILDITELASLSDFAQQVASELQPGTILALQGELGTGKTTFTQQLLKQLGVVEPVTSPTFTLMNQFQTPDNQHIYHLDLYRLKNQKELDQIGLTELLVTPNIVIIEWPELASALLPPQTWWLQFQLADDKRSVFIRKGSEDA